MFIMLKKWKKIDYIHLDFKKLNDCYLNRKLPNLELVDLIACIKMVKYMKLFLIMIRDM